MIFSPGTAMLPCTYQLRIRIQKPLRLRVGSLGVIEFPAGYYAYTGSAKRNLFARIGRHLSRDKTLRWHIDYLLAESEAAVVGVWIGVDPECTVNRSTAGSILVPRFGASDCRAGCGSHLKFLGRAP